MDWSKLTRSEKYKALRDAISVNNISELKSLVENGIDINTTEDYTDQNVLIYYILNADELKLNSTEMINYFVESGIDLDHAGNKRTEQMSALHYAVLSKSFRIVISLVENGANVDQQDKNGNTALWKGVMNYRGNVKMKAILEYLVSKGASMDIENFYGNSPKKMIEMINGGIEAGHNNPKWDLSDLLKE